MSFVIHQGDALTVLRTLPDCSVHMVVTSPPYWGLRDYGCVGQLGLEATPAEYISKMVEVFREVRRVLRDDGTCFVNEGDSYAGSWGAQGRQGDGAVQGRSACYGRLIAAAAKKKHRTGSIPEASGLKPKDLCLIPWHFAIAMQEDGWWCRDIIVWDKPAPMPESVRDRCTKSWEPIFMFAKSKKYYFDQDAIREPDKGTDHPRNVLTAPDRANGFTAPDAGIRTAEGRNGSGRNKRNVWRLPPMATPDAHFATFPLELPETCIKAGCPEGGTVLDPFAGAGTTGLACLKNARSFIGIELSAEYIEIAHNRVARHYPLFAEGTLGDDGSAMTRETNGLVANKKG